jgi:sulfotransferase family protein
VIQTHRSPREAIASACSLAAHATEGWSHIFTGAVIGRDQLELWARGLEHFMAARSRHDQARFCDVRYAEFVADPVGTIETIYDQFEIPLTGQAADAMRALQAGSAGAGGPGPGHRYALADFGLAAEQVDERFAGYLAGAGPG